MYSETNQQQYKRRKVEVNIFVFDSFDEHEMPSIGHFVGRFILLILLLLLLMLKCFLKTNRFFKIKRNTFNLYFIALMNIIIQLAFITVNRFVHKISLILNLLCVSYRGCCCCFSAFHVLLFFFIFFSLPASLICDMLLSFINVQ